MRILAEGTTGMTAASIKPHLETLAPYQKQVKAALHDTTYGSPETSLAAPRDEESIITALTLAKGFRPTVKTVLLVGIGGSDLGTRAIFEALHEHRAAYGDTYKPRLLHFDTVEPRILNIMRETFAQHTQANELVLVVVSKSGNTAETLVNANVLFGLFSERFGKQAAAKQTIVLSDADAALATTAQEQGIAHIAIPKAIGGRFSVFTGVGLVPLALLGIDIRSLCAGAAEAGAASAPETGVSGAALLASLLFESQQQGVALHELFLCNPELETLGKWYRQLLAESVGKQRGDGVPVGITPTVAIGSTDLHSLGQLIFGGPKNRFTTFVAAPSQWNDAPVCRTDSPFVLPMLAGKESGAVMRAIYTAVGTTYQEHELPYIRIELNSIDERELGAFMAVQMASVMYLGKLLGVNTFDQPSVEAYKTETKHLLSS